MTLTAHEEHIASLIVQCLPGQIALCQRRIMHLSNTEIFHQTELGKMIVVICSSSTKALMENIDRIRDFPEVATVSLVYHQMGDTEEFDQSADVDQELETYFEQVQSGAFSDFGEFK